MEKSNTKVSLSSIRDNRKHGTVGKFLKDNVKPNAELSFVSAYFTIYAYNHLKENLEGIKYLRFLFGEPTFIKSLDPAKTNKRDFKIEDDGMVIPIGSRMVQNAIARECSEWLKSKVDIKSMVKPNFLHGKMYHIAQESGVEKAVAGSSNFTVNGLGLGIRSNIELNLVVDSDRDRGELIDWFDELWHDDTGLVEDVKDEVLNYLAEFYVDNEPEFIYYKTLYHIFSKYIDDQKEGGLLNEKTGFYDTEIWNALYNFQQDGVKGAINKILKHNGCIIADSVGLGKTYEALAVIRYFELLNKNILVLCPKKLENNWKIYQTKQHNSLNPFKKDKFNYTLLYHTDMGRRTVSDANAIDLQNFEWGNFDLVVIDESHNFRGNPMDKVKKDGATTPNRAKWLMEEIIKKGVNTKVLMLSATPVNNTLRDLRNQISLITKGNSSALFDETQIKDIALVLKNAQTQFTNWADSKRNPNRTQKQLIERLDPSFFKLLDTITIARSRKHIKNFYKTESIGKFPVRLKPLPIYPKIDTEDIFPTYDILNKKILEYKLSVFNPSKYVLPGRENTYGIKTKEQKEKDKKEREERKRKRKKGHQLELTSLEDNFDQSDREHFLIGMMKVNFLKRLESSIQSFEFSLERTIGKIAKLENKIRKFKEKHDGEDDFYEQDFEPTLIEQDENSENDEEQIVGKKLKFKLKDLNLDGWLADLKKDKEAMEHLFISAKDVTQDRDSKLKDLKKLIEGKIKSPLNKNNKKVIIFTAYSDTANYLYSSLKDWVKDTLGLNIALVTGSYTQTTFGKNEYSNILTNFSPIAKNRNKMVGMDLDEEIDILVATDCISEGQNLQDCDYLVNYDIHWNPVRIIQRFGRIDRLGSKNTSIQLVNFWPTKDLDSYINLKERVEARMALVDVTATSEDNLLATDQIEELIEDEFKYRNQQLLRLKDEVLDLEDMDESISITDFTLDDFRVDLINFLENNRKKLEDAPFGLYAVVPSPQGKHRKMLDINLFTSKEADVVTPGVVFCLKQKGDTTGNEAVNPLQPYFLVYIRDDGTVRYNYTNAKHVLEMYRLLCQGHTEPFKELCSLFNEETKHGKDMDKYDNLIKKAVHEIMYLFKHKANQQLTSERGAVLIPQQKHAKDLDSFELITWLVIK